jgi:AraC-like DNA-binding protein
MTQVFKSLEYKGKIVFSKAVLGGFQRTPKHFAADESCYLFLSKGYFNLRTPDKVLEFRQGDGLLAKCGNYFIESHTGAPAEPLEVVAAYFHPSIVKPFFPGDLTFNNFKPDFDASKFPSNDLLRFFIESIDFLLENPSFCSEELVAIKLKELLLLLTRTDNAPSIHQFIASLFKPYEYDFRETIHQNALSNLSLSELATLCNMSLATFKRRFAEVFSESPAQYLNIIKLNRAAELLLSPEIQISSIVYDCGFESASHFSKSFKKHHGLSPSEYRLSQLNQTLSR